MHSSFVLFVRTILYSLTSQMIAVDDLRYQFGVQGPGAFGPGCGTTGTYTAGCTGMHTPSIDALVARPGSALFRKHYVQMSVCAASRASILTGRRPDASKWGQGYWRETAGNFTTIPEFFKLEGYTTIGCGEISQT